MDTFTITWLPYYLDPSAPRESVTVQERTVQKVGADRVEQIQAKLHRVGAAEGINFKFGGRTGNTRDSHRLVQLAKTKSTDLQNRVVEQLFRTHFEEEGDITSHAVLVDVGVATGLEAEEVRQWLREDCGGVEVDREAEEVKQTYGRGVPQYKIQGKYHVDGADDPSAFFEAFIQVKEEEAAQNSG